MQIVTSGRGSCPQGLAENLVHGEIERPAEYIDPRS